MKARRNSTATPIIQAIATAANTKGSRIFLCNRGPISFSCGKSTTVKSTITPRTGYSPKTAVLPARNNNSFSYVIVPFSLQPRRRLIASTKPKRARISEMVRDRMDLPRI
eukprot:UN11302